MMTVPVMASETFQPNYNPSLQVSPAHGSIKIDGELNDPGWKKAAKADNFAERHPGDMIPPLVNTEVYVTYDADNLYVAFVCHDDPESIRATMCQRDQFYGDDAVCLLLDTFGDATRAYELFVNPYGIQKDQLWSSIGGEDSGFDLIWQSAAEITDDGYQVEIAVPFSSLRFPNKDVQTWKIDFWRTHPRESFHQYSWAGYDLNEQCWVCQWGTANGISSVQPGKGMEILPAFVASEKGSLPDRNDPESEIEDGDILGEASVGFKYSISSDMILDASVNPDYSQIEADAAQINVNSPIALFYPERRPYFQEGTDIFRTLFNSFYTRTINDPIFTAKMTSRKDRTSFGFVSAYDETSPYVVPLDESTITLNGGESFVNVFRILRTIGDDTHVGFILSDRRFKNSGSGTVVGVDGDIRLTSNYSIDGQFLVAHTQEPDDDSPFSLFKGEAPYGYDEKDVNAIFEEYYGLPRFGDSEYTFAFDGESYSGTGLIARLKRRARHLNFTLDYNQVSPTYRTQVGFDPYINYRNFSVSSFYRYLTKDGLVQGVTPSVYTLSRWDFDGMKKLQLANFGIGTQLRAAQIGLNINYSLKEEMYVGEMYKKLWSSSFSINGRPSNQLHFSTGFTIGRDIAYYQMTKGDEISGYASFDWKPIDRLMIEPNLNYAQSTDIDSGDELFRQMIVRTRFRLQINREFSVRLVVQYNHLRMPGYERKTWEADPLFTYRLSSFSVFYFGSTSDIRHVDDMPDGKDRWRLTDRQFFMKIQYLFQT
jgi:hypothetical protein